MTCFKCKKKCIHPIRMLFCCNCAPWYQTPKCKYCAERALKLVDQDTSTRDTTMTTGNNEKVVK